MAYKHVSGNSVSKQVNIVNTHGKPRKDGTLNLMVG